MRVLALLGIFVLTVVLLTAAWRMSIRGTPRDSLLPIGVGMLVAYGIQAFTWTSLCKFPRSHEAWLRIGFPLSATLIAASLGGFLLLNYLDFFYPEKNYATWEKEKVIWGAAMSAGLLGFPALAVGVLLLVVCSVIWLRNR